jgi:NitT/TauT family transport system substrate-binding protein
VVERFVTAMRQSLDYANEHPDEVRRIVPTFTSITPDVARRMKLPVFATRVRKLAVDEVFHVSEEYGLVDQHPDIDEMFAASAL